MPRISELSSYPGQVTGSDFFPIVQSSSLDTYRVSISELLLSTSTGSFTGSFVGDVNGNITG